MAVLQETLDAIPALYQEVNLVSVDSVLPAFLAETKIGQIPLFEWVFVLVGMPAIYLLTRPLDSLLSPLPTVYGIAFAVSRL